MNVCCFETYAYDILMKHKPSHLHIQNKQVSLLRCVRKKAFILQFSGYEGNQTIILQWNFFGQEKVCDNN